MSALGVALAIGAACDAGVNPSFLARGAFARPSLQMVSTNWTVASVELMIRSGHPDRLTTVSSPMFPLYQNGESFGDLAR